MTTAPDNISVRGVLARQEMRHYARSPLFLIGTVVAYAVLGVNFAQDDGSSSTMSMIVPAALIGLLGMVVMAGLVKRSDRTAQAAGSVGVSEYDRTLALAAAALVPLVAALVWFAGTTVLYVTQPAASWAVPFGKINHAHVLAIMFSLVVIPAVSGPLVGLLVARWIPRRGAVVVAVVTVVLITILLQGNFEATWRWHVVWPWTYWYGPLGWSATGGESTHWMALPGSPFAWIGYLVTLCVLGLLVALYHDPEADRPRLSKYIIVTAAIAAVALVLTMTMGLDAPISNPIPGPTF